MSESTGRDSKDPSAWIKTVLAKSFAIDENIRNAKPDSPTEISTCSNLVRLGGVIYNVFVPSILQPKSRKICLQASTSRL